MQIRIAPDPQLAVCKGLVADRVYKLKAGQAILKWRCCRASYGIVCAELYNPKNPEHIGRKTRKDLKDGKIYLQKVISWFIKKVGGLTIALKIYELKSLAGGASLRRSSYRSKFPPKDYTWRPGENLPDQRYRFVCRFGSSTIPDERSYVVYPPRYQNTNY